MILTGREIARRHARGEITLDPFDPRYVNPCSYNYRLAPVLRTHTETPIDPLAEPRLSDLEIPSRGFVLEPGRVYLGTTFERIGAPDLVTLLIGRSSVGRLGLFVQYAADLGHNGVAHRWTLEIKAVQPIRVYPHMVLGQVSFWTTDGATDSYGGHFGRFDEATVPPPGHLSASLIPSPRQQEGARA
jgi:dCTP deaminase